MGNITKSEVKIKQVELHYIWKTPNGEQQECMMPICSNDKGVFRAQIDESNDTELYDEELKLILDTVKTLNKLKI